MDTKAYSGNLKSEQLHSTTLGVQEEPSEVYVFPTSFAQQRFWFLEQFRSGNSLYHTPMIIQFFGELDVSKLEKSIHEIVRRHEILRTTISAMEGQPVQVIQTAEAWEKNSPSLTPTVDWRHLPTVEQDEQIEKFVAQEQQRRFDLVHGPLWRMNLIRLAEDKYLLLFVRHHIIFDAWSARIFFHELVKLYEAFSQGYPTPLPELPIQYADFSIWQREWVESEHFQQQWDFWKQQLEGELPILALPTDYLRPPIQTHRGGFRSITLSPTLSKRIRTFSQNEHCTLFMVLLTAFKILLYRYTGQEQLTVGTPVANRTQPELEVLIGCLLNTLVLRTDIKNKPTVRELLSHVRQVVLNAYSHQDMPFEKLVDALGVERNMSHHPLFQVMINLHETFEEVEELSDVTVMRSREYFTRQEATWDLMLHITEMPEALSIGIIYNADLFHHTTIERMLGHYQTLLEGMVTDPEMSISELPLLTEAERHQLLVEWNDTQVDSFKNLCMHRLFEAQVRQTPKAVALLFEDDQLSYQELDEQANQVAHYLIQLGVGTRLGKETKVGICVERSIKMITSILGILKAGGIYVPLDPSYPPERIEFMLEDAEISVLLTDQPLEQSLSQSSLSRVEEYIHFNRDWSQITQQRCHMPTVDVQPDNVMCILYTSGSTGQPKGVLDSHRGVASRIAGMKAQFPLTTVDRVLQQASLSFDVSIWESFLPLISGATLVLASPDGHADPDYLIEIIRQKRITVVRFNPSLLRLLITTSSFDQCTSLRHIFCGGEVLPIDLVQSTFSKLNIELHNLYGPTEAAIHVSHWRCMRNYHRPIIPIGRPVSNVQLYIVDPHLQPVPIGVAGEILIGGIQVAHGYYKRPELTSEKFIPNHLQSKEQQSGTLYKTGDLARWLPDGTIEYLGRIDQQVKIRGFRVELGEIEHALLEQEGVREAVVLAREENNDKQLVAYIVKSCEVAELQSEEEDPTILRQILAQQLPDYMIPSAFVFLDAMPLTPNGKLERRALPAPNYVDTGSEFVAPRTQMETAVAAIWQEVLHIDEAGVYDNFFALGGHSLKATQVVSRIRDTFQVEMPLRRLFETPTIAGLVEYIAAEFQKPNRVSPQTSSDEEASYSSLVPIQPHGSKQPFFLVPGGGGGEEEFLIYAQLLYLLGAEQPVYGFYARGLLDSQSPHEDVETMAADYIQEMRTVQPHGPYLLGGECIGGKVAYEMARQLQLEGEQVGCLLLMNTGLRTNVKRVFRLHRQFVRQQRRIQHHRQQLEPLSFAKRLRYVGQNLHNWQIRRLPLTSELSNMQQKQRVRANYTHLLQRYRPQEPYSDSITLLVSTDDYQENIFGEWEGWVDRVEINQVPGVRKTYLGKHVQTTAARLSTCLEVAHQKVEERNNVA